MPESLSCRNADPEFVVRTRPQDPGNRRLASGPARDETSELRQCLEPGGVHSDEGIGSARGRLMFVFQLHRWRTVAKASGTPSRLTSRQQPFVVRGAPAV